MRVIADNICDDLNRVIPNLIESIPRNGRSTRLENQIRIARICLKKMNKSKKID